MTSLDGATRFEMQSGDRWPKDDPNSDRGRSEVSQDGVLTYGTDWWLRWKFRLTAGLLARDQNIVGQVHAADSLGSRGPIFSLDISRDGPRLDVRTAEDRSGATPWRYITRYSEPFEIGTAYEFIARMRFGLAGTGQLDFWISKEGAPFSQVLALSAIDFGYTGDDAAYFKWGLYLRPFDQLADVVATYTMRGPTKDSLAP